MGAWGETERQKVDRERGQNEWWIDGRCRKRPTM